MMLSTHLRLWNFIDSHRGGGAKFFSTLRRALPRQTGSSQIDGLFLDRRALPRQTGSSLIDGLFFDRRALPFTGIHLVKPTGCFLIAIKPLILVRLQKSLQGTISDRCASKITQNDNICFHTRSHSVAQFWSHQFSILVHFNVLWCVISVHVSSSMVYLPLKTVLKDRQMIDL